MARPTFQVALDNQSLPSALEDVRQVGDIVDIVEAGTVLIYQEGIQAVKALRALFPDKILIADVKCADAGGTVAKNLREAGADWMTCISAATIPTMKAAAKEISEVQVELYGNWTKEDAQGWYDAGITQAIYHQSRDALLAGGSWGEKDLNRVKMLVDMGFRVSVTGGLTPDKLQLFEGVNVFDFIAGRAITQADDPRKAAQAFHDEIVRLWGE